MKGLLPNQRAKEGDVVSRMFLSVLFLLLLLCILSGHSFYLLSPPFCFLATTEKRARSGDGPVSPLSSEFVTFQPG